MAASTVAATAGSFNLMLLLFAMASLAMAQTVLPSNATLLDATITQVKLIGGDLSQVPYNITPLTIGAGKGQTPVAIQQITYAGNAKLADSQTINNLTSDDIAFISCDPNESNTNASQTVANAGALKPKGIILYSQTANECILAGSTGYSSIYSMVSLADTNSLITNIGGYHNLSSPLQAHIGTNSTATGVSSSAGTSDNSNDGGPAPTTAVAMSILYSITGIITLLFLIIIATGAVRAHRHPERYGPRSGYSGRSRQSRAKGLARAMLETLPIVKFGDPEPAKPVSRDVELENGNPNAPELTTIEAISTAPGHLSTIAEAPPTPKTPAANSTQVVESGMGAAQAESIKEDAVDAPKEGELGCSICTEDFTTGEDVRVLPCNHKYHPACIDPWLLNVSGTCPLCRHDLRPTASVSTTVPAFEELPPPLDGDNATETLGETSGEAPLNTTGAGHRQNRISRFLDLNRLRHAPVDERIAVLRELREQSRREETLENADERSRRRLTGRLRDTFRIRTRPESATN